ncbi:MAG TPA: Rrf2 family transcriptional regulator [Niabella sp.]|nr:Rrf2 family transcriptional regulator [Niabella sp.]HOZ97223.1 Rrf2 family transcriptional regulator [Niabella sp.]HQW14199.1 Rrf2 family transcriptional regulator [Niabella sp.]HQX19599.1 Rrf2 family transcriptional regulator [Niabella sp.]HQX39967.1 Rrf2 family transcriptional regulator [Niabella sp.]
MFSKSTEYALRATIYIARWASIENKVSLQTVANGIGAPQSFTAKILQQLTNKKTGIVSSVSGPTGGFYITEKSKKLPIIKILEVMEEIDTIMGCILGFPNCSDENPCSMHRSYKSIKIDIFELFQERTIEDLANAKDRLM